jgi:hypothetical protein
MNPCHRWTNYNNVTNIGYGNLNTINSWWFSQRIIRQDVFILPAYYTCAIDGPTSFCQGGSTTLTSNPQVVPIGATGGEIFSTIWSGPGIVGSNTGNSITVDSDGTYSVVTKWVSDLGDTCEISCDLSLTLDPPLTGSIDTLILLGQSVEVNGESYSHPGEYTQLLTSLNGCDSILTIRVKVAQTTILYNLNACVSHNDGDGTDMDYSEFTPLYPQPLSCANVTGSILFRDPPAGNKHSCTNGVNNSVAMCVSSLDGCTYAPGDQKSVVFEITVAPSPDTAAQLTGLTFFEQGPTTFNWLSGNSGPNNYPTLFGIRVLKNGTEIYRRENIPTTTTWTEETFDFADEIDFITNEPAVFRFELLPYCLIGNGAAVAAWDIDEIKVSASCVPFNFAPIIEGVIATEGGHNVKNVEMQMSEEPTFQSVRDVITNQFGQYKYDHNKYGSNYYIKGTKDTEPRNGVSTLDLVLIQKHLLGIKTFQSPYQMVAADANHSSSVSVLDLLELRKLILGIYTSLPHNTSWRFGNVSQDPNTHYAWGFKETIEIEALTRDIHDANFTAVKIGDVNSDAKTNLLGSDITSRNDAKMSLFVEDKHVVAGVPVRIDFTTSVLSELAGLQLALHLGNLDLQQVLGGKINLTTDNYNLTQDGLLRISWNDIESINTTDGDILFSIVAIPTKSGYLSEMLSLVPSALDAEAYAGADLEKLDLDLDMRRLANNSGSNTLFQNEPNPFAVNTKIRFQLEKSGLASIRLYDLSGHLLKEINDQFTSGMNEVEISNTELGIMNGVVICQLQSNRFVAVQRMVLMR